MRERESWVRGYKHFEKAIIDGTTGRRHAGKTMHTDVLCISFIMRRASLHERGKWLHEAWVFGKAF